MLYSERKTMESQLWFLTRGGSAADSAKRHQDYVDGIMAKLSERQRGRIGKLWGEQERVDPDMPNRGASFVRIMEHVATRIISGPRRPIVRQLKDAWRPGS